MLPLFALLQQITDPTPLLPPSFFPPKISSFWGTSTAITSLGLKRYFRPPWGGSIWLGHLLWLPYPQWPWLTYFSTLLAWHFFCSLLSRPILLLGGASKPGFWSLTNSTICPSFSDLLPQRTSFFPQYSESSLGWLCLLLWHSLFFCRGILISSSAAALFTSLTSKSSISYGHIKLQPKT